MDCFLWTDASMARNQITTKYEPLQPFLFLSFLKFSGVEVVLDVGANVGLYSLVSTMADSVQSVYAFEPDESAYQALDKNIRLNGVDTKVKPILAAVSNAEGIARFGSHSPMSGVNGILNTSIHEHSIFSEVKDVKTIRLDRLEGISGKVLGIKIDVEGHEMEVIGGAVELLKKNPSVIQVEHYVGNGIDAKLRSLGYYSFFAAGHDHYFTNIINFSNPLIVKQAIEHAATWLVESHSGRWPDNKTIKNSLSLSCEVFNDVIHIKAALQGDFFSNDVEYAFYLIVDGVKSVTKWYRSEPCVQFSMVEEAESVEIKGFVREKDLPDKKVAVSVFVKQPATGYRAGSAVDDSLGLPSQYGALIRKFEESNLYYSQVNFSPILHHIAKQGPSDIIQLGVDSGTFEIITQLHANKKGLLSVICTPSQQSSFMKSLSKHESRAIGGRVDVYPVTQAGGLKIILEMLAHKLVSACCVVLRDQFLADIGQNVEVLKALFGKIPADSKVYAEGLANASHHKKLIALTNEFGLRIEWLYPRSTIIPSELLNESEEVNEQSINSSFTTGYHSERAFSLDFALSEFFFEQSSIVVADGKSQPEGTLELNFSLQEEQGKG